MCIISNTQIFTTRLVGRLRQITVIDLLIIQTLHQLIYFSLLSLKDKKSSQISALEVETTTYC